MLHDFMKPSMKPMYIIRIQTLHYEQSSADRCNNINTHIIVRPMNGQHTLRRIRWFAVSLRPQHTTNTELRI